MSAWTVRQIRREDASAVLGLARTLDAWFNEEGLALMERDLHSHEGFVAERDGTLIGFATWNPIGGNLADLTWMGVARAEQRGGIGRALLEALAADVRIRGFHRIVVSTVADSVDYEPYVGTRAFYRAMGFTDERVDPLYFGSGEDRYDRLVMKLDLPA